MHFQVYSGTFSNVQAYSGTLRHIEPYSDIRTLYNPCIYNRIYAFRTVIYLERGASSKVCQTCKMIRHIHSPGIFRTVYSSIFKDLGIFRDIDAYSVRLTGVQLRGGDPDCVYLWVKFSIQNVVLMVPRRKKIQNISLWVAFFLCFWRNVYWSALFPWNFHCPEKIRRVCLQSSIILFGKCSILNVYINLDAPLSR